MQSGYKSLSGPGDEAVIPIGDFAYTHTFEISMRGTLKRLDPLTCRFDLLEEALAHEREHSEATA